MDLRSWIVGDHEAVRRRFLGAIATHVPHERWRERVDGGGSSIAALLLHVTVHQDLARTAIGIGPPLFAVRAKTLGLAPEASPLASLQEAEDRATTSALDLDALEAYAAEVHEATIAVLADLSADDLDAVPPASERLADLGGVTVAEAPWLHEMWQGKPAAWFVQWEIIGHAQGHVGEMVSMRDRMGLRPF